jgi:cyanophycin synthetase
MISIPGDRRDEDIVEMGRLGAKHFDKLYFREDPGNRGRPRGAVIELMRQGALAAGAADPDITLIVNEREAVIAALAASEPGDLLVLTPTLVEDIWREVVAFRPAEVMPATDNVFPLERRA